jgi:hypothetical protein
MSRYMLVSRFRDLTIMPGADVDLIEAQEPDYLQNQLDLFAARIDAKLCKRYTTPFGDEPAPAATVRQSVPGLIEDWLVSLVTPRAYAKRGVNPSSGELWFTEFVINPAVAALKEIDDAANGNEARLELPLKSTSEPGADVTRSGPLAYTETSPYVWLDVQADAAREEDTGRSGTSS